MQPSTGIMISAAAVFAIALFQHARTGNKGDTLAAILLATAVGVFIGMQVQKARSGDDAIAQLRKVTTYAEFSTLAAEDKPLLVMTYTQSCHYCHKLAPKIVELATEYAGRANVVAVEHNKVEPQLARAFNVEGYPTVMFYHEGTEQARVVGARGKAEYTKHLDSLLAKTVGEPERDDTDPQGME